MGCFSTTVQAPAPLDPAKVGADSLATQLRLAPDVYGSEALYRPRYAELDQRILNSTLFGGGEGGTPGLLDIYSLASGRLGEQQLAANRLQREADIADVAQMGGAARQAWLSANPELARTMNSLESSIFSGRGQAAPQVMPRDVTTPMADPYGDLTATRAGGSSLSPVLLADAMNYGQKSPLQQELERQAREGLRAGSNLTPSELSDVQQSTRSAYAARGLYDSNEALGAEVLNTDAARRARLAERQGLAGAVDAAGQAQLQAGRNFGLGVEGQLLNSSLFNAGQANQMGQFNAGQANQMRQFNAGNLLNSSLFNAQQGLQGQMYNTELLRTALNDQYAREFQLANMYQGQSVDPYQLVLGRSGTPGMAMSAAGQGMFTQGAAPRLFDPFNQQIMNIYAGNQANQLAARAATANNRASLLGSLFEAGGQLGGAAILACWVARAVYGPRDPRWRRVRRWMLTRAPEWLRAAYFRKGPAIARRIPHEPELRQRWRHFFDRLLGHLDATT